jgi:hypothetical protein
LVRRANQGGKLMIRSEKLMIRKIGLVVLLLAMGCLCAHAADISGKWQGKFLTPVGINNYTYNFQVNGNALTGTTLSSVSGASVIQNGKIEGDTLSFTEPSQYNGNAITVTYTGKIIGDKIKLTHTFGPFPPDTFTISRSN